MTPDRWKKVEEIFNAAVEMPAEEREAYLSEVCVDDSDLRQEVERLLALDEEAGDFIEAPVAYSEITKVVNLPISGELTSTLIGQQIGAYRLEREIGRGGMGAVYLAARADNEFSKFVAIKLVKRGMDTDFIIRRFRNERQILANLDHPNIAHLLDGGTTQDGLPYFVMEYIEGLPITKFCDTNQLTIRERLKLFVKVCEAVHYAHQKMVIHRDIKPGNILVTQDNTPKLLDFGIAKILNPEFAQDTLDPTATSMRLMTPVYASPEQARGERVTAASDQYSLGVLLYELLTGHRPYKLRNHLPHEIVLIISEQQPDKPSLAVTRTSEVYGPDGKEIPITPATVAQHRNTTIVDLQEELSGSLDDIVMQALSKDLSERYPSVEKFAEDISHFLAGQPVIARTYFLSSAQIHAAEDTPATHNSIAILPLKLLSFSDIEETGGNFLKIGLADSLITRLSNIRSLIVRPTASVLKFANEESDAVAAGRELDVNYVLDGRIIKAGERIRITVQLIDVRTAAPQWAAQFDENYTDILELQDSISEQVAQAITQKLSGEELEQLSKRGTNNVAAYEAYLRGRYHWHTYTEAGLAKAITYFYQAIALDENFAAAYSGVADYQAWLGITSVLPPEECFLAAKDAATRALQIDDKLAEAYASLGMATWAYDWDFQKSEILFKKAFELNNNYAQAHEWYAFMRSSQGRHEEAIHSMERALEIDPYSPALLTMMSFVQFKAQQTELSSTYLDRALEIDPNYYLALQATSWTHTRLGRIRDALGYTRIGVEVSGRSPIAVWGLIGALVAADKKEEARRWLDILLEMSWKRYVPSYFFMVIYTMLGQLDVAFDYLHEALAQREFWILWLPTDPDLAPMRKDPRFENYVKRLQLAITHSAPSRSLETIAIGNPNGDERLSKASTTQAIQVPMKEQRAGGQISAPPPQTSPSTMEMAARTVSLDADKELRLDASPGLVSAKPNDPSAAPVSDKAAGKPQTGRAENPSIAADTSSVLDERAAQNAALSASETLRQSAESDAKADAVIDSRLPASRVGRFPRRFWLMASAALLVGFITLAVFKWSDWFGGAGLANQTYPLRLTNNPGDDQLAKVSPDGKRIAFASNRDGKPEIYTMDAEGGPALQRLTFNTVADTAPAWSPDGRKIAFDNIRIAETESDIYVMDDDGGNQVNLTNAPGYDTRAAWSPDGKRLAFASNRAGAQSGFDIYVMNQDGSNVRQLTSDPEFEDDPTWSPDGKRIAFTRGSRQGQFDIFVMDADGSNPVNLTNNPASDNTPVWSPDGKFIAFSSSRATNNRASQDIYVMNADGSNPRRITTNSANDTEPAWMSDSHHLIFQSNRDGNVELYVTDMESNTEIQSEAAGAASGEKKTIAVLPFKTAGTNELDASLGLGLADALTSKLGQIKQLSVRPAGASHRYTNVTDTAQQVGRELAVGYVLGGTLNKVDDRMEVTSQLVDVKDGKILWAEKFDEKVADISALQSSIAERVAKALTLELTPFEIQRLSTRNTENSEAYQLYLVGRYQWSKRTANGLREAIKAFEQAIKKDANFALAYAGLADCYAMLNLYQDLSPSAAFPKAKENATRALVLDEQLSEAHASLAYVKFYYDRNRPEAEREFRRAMELNPSYATAHHWFALVLAAMGRTDEALSEGRIAQQLDPRSAIIYSAIATVYFYARQYDLAVEQAHKALEIDPGLVPAHRVLRWTYGAMNRYDDAVKAYISEKGYSGDSEFEWPVIVAQLEAIGGKQSEAQAALKRGFASPAFKNGANYMLYEIAVIYALLNDHDQAFAWLNKAEGGKTYLFNFAAVDPRLDNLRMDARFTELLKKLGAAS
jgi:Tol biopolymer transport system component/TolB-like protein/Tfp pilus assembly protein PilF/tRNA A-37 threonylcarbamoyl transferase component Bud32